MSSSGIAFRQLEDKEEDLGYRVMCETVAWLRAKNIALWHEPLPRKAYSARQKKGQNFAMFVDGRIAVILSLVQGVPDYWAPDIENRDATWLCTMATATQFRGRKLGLRALKEAKAFLAARGERELYLDCKPGFLEDFYKSAGFSPIATRELPIPHASPTEPISATLMRCPLIGKRGS
jgi:hypothetical protein